MTKLPDLSALKAEYDRLAAEKDALAGEYGKAKKTLQEYGVIKKNVDGILRRTPERERTQEL
ncbi:MAG: hypothetical protein RR091_11915 [Cloacibacillus sp.]